MPSVVYSGSFDWNGVAAVTETVTQDDTTGRYTWDFHVTNESFSAGIASFALPVEDASMVSGLGNTVGWSGSVGTFAGEPGVVAWQAGLAGGNSITVPPLTPPGDPGASRDPTSPPVGNPPGPTSPPVPAGPLMVGQTAEFWFTTGTTGIALTNGFVSDPPLVTFTSGLLVIPTAAPVPKFPTLDVFSAKDPDDKELTLRQAMDKIENGLKVQGQKVTDIRFAPVMAGKTIVLSEELPAIATGMSIDGTGRNITIKPDPNGDGFRLFNVTKPGVSVSLAGLTLTGGVASGLDSAGGAIESIGNLAVTNCTITRNQAERGGGIAAIGGTLSIFGSVVGGNEATGELGGSGGGVFIGSQATNAYIGGSVIVGNLAGTAGGGIDINTSGTAPSVQLDNDIITLNSAEQRGGGVAVETGTGMPQLLLSGGTLFTLNSVSGDDSKGGGVYLGAGVLWTNGVTVTGNSAAIGGGLYLVVGSYWAPFRSATVTLNLPDDIDGGDA